MSDIPEDIWQLAHEVCDHCEGAEGEEIYSASEKAIARAILAERKRCAEEARLMADELRRLAGSSNADEIAPEVLEREQADVVA